MSEEKTTETVDESLQIFDFNKNRVRVIDRDAEPWFVARDLCSILGIINVSQAVQTLDDDEKDTISVTYSDNKPHKLLIISESGMYALVFQSKKPVAKKFSKWVRKVVLREIRKTGSFNANKGKTELELLLEAQERSVETLKKMVENERKLLSHERKLQWHESIVLDHESRIESIENISQANTRRLMQVERAEEPAKEKSTRSKLNQIVRAYCLAKNVNYSEAWRFLYSEYKYRYHKDIPIRWSKKVRKLERANPGKRIKFDKLDLAEEMGCMHELYVLASSLFALN